MKLISKEMNVMKTVIILCMCVNIQGFRFIPYKQAGKVKLYCNDDSDYIENSNRNAISKSFEDESQFYSESFAFNEFNPNTTMYTIISAQSSQVTELLINLRNHNKNFVYVNIKYFTNIEFMKFITDILPSYVLDMVNESLTYVEYVEKMSIKTSTNKKLYTLIELNNKINKLRNSTFIFENEYDYIGGIFEMYERMCQDDNDINNIDSDSLFIFKDDDKYWY